MNDDKDNDRNPPCMYPNMAMVLLSALGNVRSWTGGRVQELLEKPCKNCGKTKRHNNAFCSGDCCREFKAKQRSN